jgi:hypothetical protein
MGWIVSFTPRPLYSRGKSSRYPLGRRLGGPQSRSVDGGGEKNSHHCRHQHRELKAGRSVLCLFSITSLLLLTYLLTHSLTHSLHGAGYYLKSWLSLSLSKNILLSYETRRFITVFTKARHWTLSWVGWIQFDPSIPISLRSVLMLSSHLRLGLPSGSYFRASQPKPSKYLSPPPCVPLIQPT